MKWGDSVGFSVAIRKLGSIIHSLWVSLKLHPSRILIINIVIPFMVPDLTLTTNLL